MGVDEMPSQCMWTEKSKNHTIQPGKTLTLNDWVGGEDRKRSAISQKQGKRDVKVETNQQFAELNWAVK